MTNSSLLVQYIDKSGYKKSFIAKKLGISAYAFMLKVNNKSEFWASEIAILCDLLEIPSSDKESIFFAN